MKGARLCDGAARAASSCRTSIDVHVELKRLARTGSSRLGHSFPRMVEDFNSNLGSQLGSESLLPISVAAAEEYFKAWTVQNNVSEAAGVVSTSVGVVFAFSFFVCVVFLRNLF